MITIDDVKTVSSVEMIRDGGSLAVCFETYHDAEHWLFFKVEREDTKDAESKRPDCETGRSIRVGYQSPVIVHRPKKGQTSMSWPDALELLHELRPFVDGARTNSNDWWEAMVSVAQSR